VGIFELLTVSGPLRSHIIKHPSFDLICSQAHTEGMKPLREDGIEKVRQGIITVQELARILV
jgi:type II secretory ATPase GspE/PulE/Tfp pilus assembly ATPase PilB-like protein